MLPRALSSTAMGSAAMGTTRSSARTSRTGGGGMLRCWLEPGATKLNLETFFHLCFRGCWAQGALLVRDVGARLLLAEQPAEGPPRHAIMRLCLQISQQAGHRYSLQWSRADRVARANPQRLERSRPAGGRVPGLQSVIWLRCDRSGRITCTWTSMWTSASASCRVQSPLTCRFVPFVQRV